MSILHGKIKRRLVHSVPMPFGEKLNKVSLIPQPSFDVAAMGNILVCGSENSVSLYALDTEGEFSLVSTLKIFGTARQISISESFAYVSVRDGGVAICDLREPEKPVLAYVIDSLELATGVCVANGVLAITNRHMGCELYDVRNPYSPNRIGDFLCGEAQSVWLYEHYAAIGDWINRRVQIFDIEKPSSPKKMCVMDVDGFADGVCVFKRDKHTVLIAATGHHDSKMKNRRKYNNYTYVTSQMIEEGYGTGHGIEIFDITNPLKPKRLATVKTPPLFGGPDTWRVYTDTKRCVFTDSMNGIFVIDLKSLTKPVFKGYYRLQPFSRQLLSPASVQVQTASITGAATVSGLLCAASENDGVYIFAADIDNFVLPDAKVDFNTREKNNDCFYRSKGQIHSFVKKGEYIYCASGTEGIEVLDMSGQRAFVHKIPFICNDICIFNGKIITAEGYGGIALYSADEGLCEIARFDIGENIRQVVPDKNGIYCVIGYKKILRIEIKDKELIKGSDIFGIGLLYHRHLARTLAGNFLVAQPLAGGPVLIDGGMQNIKRYGYDLCPFEDGACGHKDSLILICDGEYAYIENPFGDKEAETKKISGAKLLGNPYVCKDKLILLNRYSGVIEVIDITDVHNPVFSYRIKTKAYPEFCTEIDGEIYVSCGFDGIIKL